MHWNELKYNLIIKMNTLVLEHNMEFIKPEPKADDELCPTSFLNGNHLTDIKEEEDPLLTRYPLMKANNEVNLFSITKHINYFFLIHLVNNFKSIIFNIILQAMYNRFLHGSTNCAIILTVLTPNYVSFNSNSHTRCYHALL
jgi:hypothetical protein